MKLWDFVNSVFYCIYFARPSEWILNFIQKDKLGLVDLRITLVGVSLEMF